MSGLPVGGRFRGQQPVGPGDALRGEGSSLSPTSVLGRQEASKERNWEKKGWSRKPREGGGRRESLILRKKKRKVRAKLDSD